MGRYVVPKDCYKVKHELKCKVCGELYFSQRSKSIYCSGLCRNIQWREDNREQDRLTKENWKINNPEQHRNNQSSYQKKRSQEDVLYLLTRRLRARLGRIKDRNGVSHIEELGCYMLEVKQYLESKFQAGMTWDNYGKEWEIDHIIALVKGQNEFNLKQLCHFSNLQPLFKEAHYIKTAKEKL